jgi:hypothetical protein
VSVSSQLRQLIELGVPELAGLGIDDFSAHTDELPDEPDAVLVVHPSLVPAAKLATLLWLNGRPGFVVEDLADLDRFEPRADVTIPDRPLYLVHHVERGDDMANWTPNEALPVIAGRGRSPLTISEGISWLLQDPDKLARNRCFMTIGSRKKKGTSLDPRTPALWISGGTGRDGKENRGAPKVGWCWAGNRHTWLGFASALHRTPT